MLFISFSDATSSNIAEEKNAFALSVLRRVKTKLDGREPDVLRKASVAEQVRKYNPKWLRGVVRLGEWLQLHPSILRKISLHPSIFVERGVKR